MSRRSPFFTVFLFLVMALLLAKPCAAATSSKEKDLGVFGAWHAYAYDEGGQTVCYMVTTKTLKSTGPQKRGLPYLMITHRPVEASIDVFSYGAGAQLDPKHGVRLKAGQKSFDLFSVRDNAWARDALTDHKIAAAIRKDGAVQLLGIAAEGRMQTISDKFDTSGAAAAYKAIGRACELPEFPADTEVKKPAKKEAAIAKKPVKTAKKKIKKPPTPAKKPAKKTRATHPKM